MTTFETYFAHSDNAEKAFKKEGRKEKSESVALKNTEDQKWRRPRKDLKEDTGSLRLAVKECFEGIIK